MNAPLPDSVRVTRAIYVATLKAGTPSPLAKESAEEKGPAAKEDGKKDDEKKGDGKKEDGKQDEGKGKGKDGTKGEKPVDPRARKF